MRHILISVQFLHGHLFSYPWFSVWHSVLESFLHFDNQYQNRNGGHVLHHWHDAGVDSFGIKFAVIFWSTCVRINKFLNLPHLQPLDKCNLYLSIVAFCQHQTLPKIQCQFRIDDFVFNRHIRCILFHDKYAVFLDCEFLAHKQLLMFDIYNQSVRR